MTELMEITKDGRLRHTPHTATSCATCPFGRVRDYDFHYSWGTMQIRLRAKQSNKKKYECLIMKIPIAFNRTAEYCDLYPQEMVE